MDDSYEGPRYPQAKKLVDLNLHQYSAQKNRNTIASARKFLSAMKPSLAQNMSTSKKLVLQRRSVTSNRHTLRRAIDFTQRESTLQHAGKRNVDRIEQYEPNYVQTEFKEPFAFPKPKKLMDLNSTTLQPSSVKKNGITIGSERKFTSVRNSTMFQNATTSKKLTFQSESRNSNCAMDLSRKTTSNRENQCTIDESNARSEFKKPIVARRTIFFGDSSERPKLRRSLRNSPAKPPTYTPPVVKKVVASPSRKSINPSSKKRRSTPQKDTSSPVVKKPKREPLAAMDVSFNSSSHSDKENDENVAAKPPLIADTLDLFAAYQENIKAFGQLQISNSADFAAATRKYVEMTSKNMQMMLQLVNSNVALCNAYFDAVKRNEASSRTSSNESCDNNDGDLRKLALMNARRNQNVRVEPPEAPVKKSEIIYASMKSNMSILKTPKTDKKKSTIMETPNTHCRNVTSQNVLRQLQYLYDS